MEEELAVDVDVPVELIGAESEDYVPDPGPLPVGGDVIAPVPIHEVQPRFTPEAFERRVQGVVIVQTVIDREGNVTRVKVLKGLGYGLDESAVEAVKLWKFRPGTRNGKAVAVVFKFKINFGFLPVDDERDHDAPESDRGEQRAVAQEAL